MKTQLSVLLAVSVAFVSLQGTASATTIIDDTFSGADGTILGPDYTTVSNPSPATIAASDAIQHEPGVNLTLNPYTFNNEYNGNPITVEGGVGVIPAGSGGSASINISSSTSPLYTKPTTLTISADLEPNDITTGNTFDKEALGFYSAPQAGQSFEGFLGLALSADGTVTLLGFDTDDFNTPVYTSQAYTLGTFNPDAFHTLTYTVDTTTGAIENASLTDANGTETYSFSTDLFTSTATTYAGFYARSDSTPTTDPEIDNFVLSGNVVVPEPSTYALLAAGLIGLVFVCRRGRKLSAE